MAPPPLLSGLIEVHSHLIPAVDDGARTGEESVAIARELVAQGYEKLVCTPHFWDDLPHNEPVTIARRVRELQQDLDAASVPLRLYPGGEVGMHPRLLKLRPDEIPTYGNAGRYVLADSWAADWEAWFTPVIRHLQAGGRTVILAHPERMGMIQADPSLIRRFQDLGVLFQGNLYCFADPPPKATRRVAEAMLEQGLYFMLGGDVHRQDTLPCRFEGLTAVAARIGAEATLRLVRDNPATLLPGE